ncbi:hypothetical protein [Stutzerimonas nitrititolerans]|uniref:hypothetical protein n=1 Tax=Stutzerimonas nitrititolerans TaxID=2482751 RepID=UPI0028A2AF20|nr:hypothetical protein [Stutzerimonas nitrititolerans]
MGLESMSMAELLEIHNELAETKAGPKTFASKAKLIERITKTAEAKSIDLASFRQRGEPEATVRDTEQQTERAEAPEAPTETEAKRGKGVGDLARALIMDEAGYPYQLIAAMVNAQVDGATTSAKSVAWYASKMRKAGVEVPSRKKHFSADLNKEETLQWLSSVTVISPAE